MSLHVVPVGELDGHETTGECPCRPEQRLVERGDGSSRWAVVHRSAEGRKQHEP